MLQAKLKDAGRRFQLRAEAPQTQTSAFASPINSSMTFAFRRGAIRW